MNSVYCGRHIYSVKFLKFRTGLPCECMCSEIRTRKKISRVNVALLRAIHVNNLRQIDVLKENKLYYASKLKQYLDNGQKDKKT